MPRGVQLGSLLDQLKAEAGHSQNVAHGVSHNDALRHVLRRTQEELYTQHDWPFLRARKTVDLLPGDRYYAYPAQMTFDTINQISAAWTDAWVPLEYGIEPEHLNAWNSDLGERSSPVRRWQHRAENSEGTTFEVWPIPDSASKLMVTGKLALATFVDDTDRCTLDSTLIVLYAAAETLAGQKSEKAGIILQKAQAHFRMLKAAAGSKKQDPFVMGGGRSVHEPRIGLDYVPSGYGKGG